MSKVFKMADLRAKLEELRKQKDEAEEKMNALSLEIHKVESEVLRSELEDIKEMLPFYEAKLLRFKAYVESFVDRKDSPYTDIYYGFKKVGPGTDDDYLPCPESLDWQIFEYNLIDYHNCIEIVFEYSRLSVMEFVKDWFKGNLSHATLVSKKDGLRGMFRLKEYD